MLSRSPRSRARQGGVSLIELMIALVAGLIVSGAAVALVVSIMKTNAETIRATRLTQELRTTAEIITRDLSRARGVDDPVGNVGITSANMVKDCNTITATATCISYGYDCEADPTTNAFTGGTFQAVGLVNGKVKLVSSTTGAAACPTSSTGLQLSSDAITIESMGFTANSTDDYTLTLKGKFTNDPSTTAPLERSIAQEVQVKSAVVQ